MAGHDVDLQLPSGRVRARRHGDAAAPLVLCVHGLSANLSSFDYLGERLAGPDRQLVAIDLRGRGCSETTPPGTYGWHRHAEDVLAVADQLGADRFTLIGHSMGGAVSMAAARAAADHIERMVLIDHCGIPEPASLVVIGASVARLGTVHPSREEYLATVRSTGAIRPWSEYWDRYFDYELEPCDGGVRSRTSATAVFEDAAFGGGAYAFDHDATVYRLWRHLTMPVLLLRASQEIVPGSGFIVAPEDLQRFAAEVPGSRVVEIDATHYTVATHPDSVVAVREFLAG